MERIGAIMQRTESTGLSVGAVGVVNVLYIFILQESVIVVGTVQACVTVPFVAGVALATRECHPVPSSRLKSIATGPMLPVRLAVMEVFSPAESLALAAGAVS
jgi:hypothetical protein